MKKSSKKAKPNHKGVMRNDLPGFMRVVGNKIYVRYRGKDYATGYDNTPVGWMMANAFWAEKIKELIAIKNGEKALEDSILNIFNEFLDYKNRISKITKRTEKFYKLGFKSVFTNPNEILSEANIRRQIDNFIKNTKVSATSINIYLRAVAGFLNWASDEDNDYIPRKNYTKRYKQKVAKEVKPPYTEKEYNLFVSYFQNVTVNKEMCLLLQFLWNTGARVGETLTIKLSDLDLKNNRIFVPNKIYKGQQEALLLTPEAVEIVEQVKELAIARGDAKLFSWKDTGLPNKIMERAEKKLGTKIESRGLHGFRRGFTDKLIDDGLEILDVKDILRHKDIKTTEEFYRSFRQKELIEKMSKKNRSAP
jgi:integrase/recombinase XerD